MPRTRTSWARDIRMTDTELEQLQTAIKRQWSRVPSKKAQPYVNAFSARVRSGTKITAKVVGNHGTYTVSIQLDPQGLTSACSCYIGKHGYCHHCEALTITFVQDPSWFQVVTPKQLSLSPFMIHEASEARRPPRWRWTMHWPAVLPARVPAYNQCACGRVAAPRFIL